MNDLEAQQPSPQPWERLPEEPIEDYMKRLHEQINGYNTFWDIVRNQPQALDRLRRFLPELLEKITQLQSEKLPE